MKRTAVVIGTGPSVSYDLLDEVREAQKAGKCAVYGMNRLWRDYPDLDVFLSCNPEYYDYEWDKGLRDHPAEKWTWDKVTSIKFGINYIEGRWADGFSKDPKYIHYGHSSGFQLPQLAVHAGYKRLLLLGYDMCYAPDYDGSAKKVGSRSRHYFGEYPKELQHWPSVQVKDGAFVELIQQFEKVKEINTDIEIINCSPGSAMTCFPIREFRECL